MSLLIKALKEAEDKRGTGRHGPDWGLEPIREGEKDPGIGGQVSPSSDAATGAAPGVAIWLRRLLPIPTILLVAGVALLAYGIYVYVMTRPPAPIVPPFLPPVAARTPAPPAAQAAAAMAEITEVQGAEPSGSALTAPPAAVKTAAAPAAKQRPVQATPAPPRAPAAPPAQGNEAALNQRLMAAYASYQDGSLGEAEQGYRAVLEALPENADALLGLAATAQAAGKHEAASQWYARVLELEPGNRVARAALLRHLDSQHLANAEARLKQWLQEPESDLGERAFLHSSLGDIQGRQGRWPDAQQHYFEAVRLQPGRPEYRYNLAVSLDHLEQYRAAVDHYRAALELHARYPSSGLDPSAIRQRITELQAVLSP